MSRTDDAAHPTRFDALIDAAGDAARHAYAPYSDYPVGAAALTEDGRLITGCNVENASYGVGLCAECSLVGQLQLTGGGKIAAFACVNGAGEIIMPCGRCRQLLNEFAAESFQILTPEGIRDLEGILPQAFGGQDLAHHDRQRGRTTEGAHKDRLRLQAARRQRPRCSTSST